ncbi:hypothetical protein HH214_09655 [Mucilaginibacter robiniae]|uniref:Uncharacterized protein n=1 Tax=Mucilaginibacter robiniae TaxID=2728022 RepID=A0A7L5DZA1_9SPHI|nr:hypothetical protein [Mucilaginibacter robiniae]QJD96121.1 hypothetical protein HH214_09655 [Mucilaginibacter robiniae]
MAKIILEQFEDNYVTKGEIHSGRLGPCIAVGVYHKSSKKAWMIHHPNMDVDRPLEDFLAKVSRGLKGIKTIQIYVTGCSIDGLDPTTDAKCRNARSYVEAVLKSKYQLEQITISWGEPRDTTELVIDTELDEVRKETSNGYLLLNRPKPLFCDTIYGSNRYSGDVDQAIPWQTDQSENWRNDAANAVEALLQS